jgi:fused signal recognition particle receptor
MDNYNYTQITTQIKQLAKEFVIYATQNPYPFAGLFVIISACLFLYSLKSKPTKKSTAKISFFAQTTKNLSNSLNKLFVNSPLISEEILEQLHYTLYKADIGPTTTTKLIGFLRENIDKNQKLNSKYLQKLLSQEALKIFSNTISETTNKQESTAKVILVVGVNGVGKTTTIAKLANYYKNQGMKVCLGAADTYRAGAVAQLKTWAERAQIKIIHKEQGSDPASVAFEAAKYATENNFDICIIDTAGRLQTHENLMEQLAKIKRTLTKVVSGAPHENLIVLDATTGQNAFSQVKLFSDKIKLDGIIMSKLDGSAKGGILIGLSDQFKLPIKFIGIGEGLNDLKKFNPKEFINSIFSQNKIS